MKIAPLLLAVAYLSPLGSLRATESPLFIDRKMEAMKGTVNLIETLPQMDSVLPKNLPLLPNSSDSINDQILKQQMVLEQLKKGLGKEGLIETTPFMNKAKKSLNPKQKLAYLSTQLDELKKRTFNKKLQAFDFKVQLFHKGSMSLYSYIDLLTEVKKSPKSTDQKFIHIDLFKRLQSMESKMDLEEIQRERTLIVRRLAYRLKGDDQKKLRKIVLAYRLGDIHHKDFYTFVQFSCQKSGINMDSYPHIKAYINYILMASHLDETLLHEEVSALEGLRYSQILKNNIELALVKQTRKNINLAKQIASESKNSTLVWKKN